MRKEFTSIQLAAFYCKLSDNTNNFSSINSFLRFRCYEKFKVIPLVPKLSLGTQIDAELGFAEWCVKRTLLMVRGAHPTAAPARAPALHLFTDHWLLLMNS
jgi:hypothetical protein